MGAAILRVMGVPMSVRSQARQGSQKDRKFLPMRLISADQVNFTDIRFDETRIMAQGRLGGGRWPQHHDAQSAARNLLKTLVSRAGLEPATLCV